MHNRFMAETEHQRVHTHKTASYHKRLHSRRHIIKSFKAEANAKRTFSEKIADTLTARLGTMVFLIVNALFFITWIALHMGIFPYSAQFDPYPFNFLTFVVSLEAIFLAIIVLISQNRSAKIDEIREETALQINTIAEEEISKLLELQIKILQKQGVDLSKDPEIREMLEPTSPEEIEKALEKENQ